MKLHYLCTQVTKKCNQESGEFFYTSDFDFRSLDPDPGFWLGSPAQGFQINSDYEIFVPSKMYTFNTTVDGL